MLNSQQVKARLKDRNLMKVAKATGLHYHTVRNALNLDGMSAETLEKLSDYFESQEKDSVQATKQEQPGG